MRNERKQHNTGASAVQIHGNYNTVYHHTHHHQHTVHAHGPVVLQLAAGPAFALQAPLAHNPGPRKAANDNCFL